MRLKFKQGILALLWSSLAQVLLLLYYINCKGPGAHPRVCKLTLDCQTKIK